MLGIKRIFSKVLEENNASDRDFYLVETIPDNNNLKAGLSPEGEPAILVKAHAEDSSINSPTSLSGIKADFYINCSVSGSEDAIEEGVFNIITCKEEDINLRDFFFDFFESFFKTKKNANGKELQEEIESLSKLFSYRKKKSRQSMMGLWSELFVILNTINTDIWVEKWHEKPRSTFDFKFSNVGLDVKSFGGFNREHYFQIEQLRNTSVEQTLIISLCLKESDDGATVFDLFNLIKNKLKKTENINKIQNQLFKLAGNEIEDAKKFNQNIALETLLLLKGEDIPCLDPQVTPLGVSEIKFKSDCSAITGKEFNRIIQKKLESNEKLD